MENILKQRIVKTASLALAALEAENRRTGDGESVSHLEHHLRQYTRRNTSDFFIHKDLKGFLSRELDFYLKNEVLNLEEMEAAGVGLYEGWFQMMRLIKKVGGHIIEFLAQIEAFQKMLWEKRKFITETFYCITVGHIPEEFYPEIAACESQWEEWKELFSIDEGKSDKSRKDRRIEYLKAHPTLVLDTRHFSPDFTDHMLASFDNLDEATDGLLVKSENWQALNLLAEKYKEQVKCIYIDPPYNADASEIIYKNGYKHATWLSLMHNGLLLAKEMLNSAGILEIAIGDEEFHRLEFLVKETFGSKNYLANIAIMHNPKGRDQEHVATAHDYTIIASRDEVRATTYRLMLDEEKAKKKYSKKDKDERYRELPLRRSGSGAQREDRPYMYFPFVYDEKTDKLFMITEEEYKKIYDGVRFDEIHLSNLKKKYELRGFLYVLPIRDDGSYGRWRWGYKSCKDGCEDGTLFIKLGKKPAIYQIDYEDSSVLPKTLWYGERYDASTKGTNLLKDIVGPNPFDYPKSIFTVMDMLTIGSEDADTIIDYFAGSGTTGHAVINHNREDGGRRKFILVEMAQYFDSVLLPRIKKVTFSPEWKDGKPKRMATAEEAERSPRIVKVIRLESYEDALNNIAFDEPSGQQAMQFEDYLLQYMLQWETRKSETLLNVEKLAKPFSYQLHIHRDGTTRAQTVDLPETFAYLLGLYVQKRQALNDNGRRYLIYRGATREGRKVAVIWRETEGWKEKDYKRDKEFVAAQKLTDGMDEVYVNGDSYIPGARSLESLFKARMFAEVEA